MTGSDKAYWNSLSKANGDATTVTSQISTDIGTHAALTLTHGATGAIVGTTNTQTLTNKTINAVSNGLTVGTNELVVSSGKVGIGTINPGSTLTVAGGDISIDNTKKINLEGSSGNTYIYRTADSRVVLAVDGIEVADWVTK